MDKIANVIFYVLLSLFGIIYCTIKVPFVVLSLLAALIILIIANSYIKKVSSQRIEDIEKIKTLEKKIYDLRMELNDEKTKHLKESNEGINRRRKLMELEEILKSGRRNSSNKKNENNFDSTNPFDHLY